MKTYFLLDQYTSQQSVAKIWSVCSPKIHPLFAKTSLENYKDEGPILVTGEIQPLENAILQNPHKWQGLFINTPASEDELLNHLRALLFVTYPPDKKGILTYYNSQTAHYFFNYTQEQDLAEWLGPIYRLQWYGGTWQQKANSQLQWYEIKQLTMDQIKQINPYQTITSEQQQGLTHSRQQKIVYEQALLAQKPFDEINHYFQEAIQLNFNDVSDITDYINLRQDYPQAPAPLQLTGNNAEERLQNLASFWENK